MRVVVTGATGNIGTAVMRALSTEPTVDSVLGLARRKPELALPKAEWAEVDIGQAGARQELLSHLRGADAVIHLAWRIQSARDADDMHMVNVAGTEALLSAVAEAGTPALLYASSIGAYAAAPKEPRVDESHATYGIPASLYSLQKAYLERRLDAFAREVPGTRVVRMRPTIVARREVGSEIRRLFLGRVVGRLAGIRPLLPVVPDIPELRFAMVHSDDVAEAFRLALLSDARGAFNLADDEVMGPADLARALHGTTVPMPFAATRAVVSAAWRLHLHPTDAGWLDVAVRLPLVSSERARAELGWRATRSSSEVFGELLEGMREGAGVPTPPLHRAEPPAA
ncbi:MAG TPA: NAD-dependent epimerase/dehydratase family protein [Egibacteraceae bacterium]|nr:NAD-dependent epimerase/dehydratase family protein [Egibacteraceae bacterium]